MNKGIRVRLATDEELDDVRALDRELLKAYEATPDTVYYVAEACDVLTGLGSIVGYGGVRLPPQWPGVAFLSRAGVLPEYRGQGIQKRLIRARVAWAKRSNQATHAITYTNYYNPASSNALIAAGFKLYVPSPLYVGDDFLYWRKALS